MTTYQSDSALYINVPAEKSEEKCTQTFGLNVGRLKAFSRTGIDNMSKKIAIAGFVGIVVCGGYFVAKSLWESTAKELRAMGVKVEREARVFAKTHSEGECVDHALSKVYECDGIKCRAMTKVFLAKCLPLSMPTAGICDGVPKHNDILDFTVWAVGDCEKRGAANPEECGKVLHKLAEHCEKPRDRSGKAKAKKPKRKTSK
jgi:hypothetical protein